MTKNKLLVVSFLCILLLLPLIPASVTTVNKSSMPITNVDVAIQTGDDELVDLIRNVDPTFWIAYPKIGAPVFLKPGSSFRIIMNVTGTATNWHVKLLNEYTEYDLTITSTGTIKPFYKDYDRITLNVSLPGTIEEGLYSLMVNATVSGTGKVAYEPNSVKIMTSFPKTFTFLHITDWHLKPDLNLIESKLSLLASLQARLLNTDFIIASGDIVDEGDTASFKTARYLTSMSDTPILACPGNHEPSSKGGLDNYEMYYAPLNYSVEYGDFFIISLNISMNFYVPDYIPTMVTNLLNEHNDSKKIIFFHYPALDPMNKSVLLQGPGASGLINAINTYNVDYVFLGHYHWDFVLKENGTLYIATSTAGAQYGPREYNGYRMLTVENNNITHFWYGNNINASIPFEQLEVKWRPLPLYKDLGAKVYLKNSLDMDFSELQIKVTLKKLDTGVYYKIENATLVSNKTNGDTVVLTLKTSLSKNSEKIIRVYPSNAQAPQLGNVYVPTTAEPLRRFTIGVEVENPVSGIESVYVFYNAGTVWRAGLMELQEGSTNNYTYTFDPGFDEGKNVTLYFVAFDYAGNTVKSEMYAVYIGTPPTQGGPTLDMTMIYMIGGIIGIVVVIVIVFMIKKKKE